MSKAAKSTERKLLLVFVVLIALVVTSACSRTGSAISTVDNAEITLTQEELAQFDGLEGRKAYIAVDGIVYDVTDIPQWEGGIHQGRFQAGRDYSQEIRSEAPHGLKMLDKAVKIGILVD